MLGIIPVCHRIIENKYPDELDSINITGIFASNQNNICLTKKKKEHQNIDNILDTFNDIYKSSLNIKDCSKIIDYGFVENVHIYILLVKNKDSVSPNTLFNIIDKEKEIYCWKIFLDRFKNITTSGNSKYNVYQNILLPQDKYDNENLNFNLHCGKYNIDINLKNIYTKLSESISDY